MQFKFIPIFFIGFFFMVIGASGQLAAIEQVKGRHSKGQHGIELNGGFTKLGNYGNLGYSYNLSRTLYAKLQAGLEAGKYREDLFTFLSYTIDGGIYFAPVHIKEIFFIGLNAGACFNSDKVKVEDRTNIQFSNYGIFAGAEAEFFASDKIVLLLNAKQKYLFNSAYGSKVFFGGAGIKYVF